MRAQLLQSILTFLLPAILLATPASVSAQANTPLYSESHALVIGIDRYSRGWPRLSNAVADARAVGKAMADRGFTVKILENPSRQKLVKEMKNFFVLRGKSPDARLFLWFAGHGHTENEEGFLIPADGALPEDDTGFRLSAIPMRDISTFVRLANAKHVLAVFDACFAGTIFSGSRSRPPAVIDRAASLPVRQFLTSGDAYQEVSDDGSFRELFIRALAQRENADMNSDGFLTASEIGLHMTDRVTNLTNGRQTPRYGKLRDKNFDQGDFVFSLGGSVAPAAPAPSNDSAMELAFWNSIEGSAFPQDFTDYLVRYPNGTFVSLARRRLSTLSSVAAASQPPKPVVAAPAKPPKPEPQTATVVRPISGAFEGKWTIHADVDAIRCGTGTRIFEDTLAVKNGKLNKTIYVRRKAFNFAARMAEGGNAIEIGGAVDMSTRSTHIFEGRLPAANGGFEGKIRSQVRHGCQLDMKIRLTPVGQG